MISNSNISSLHVNLPTATLSSSPAALDCISPVASLAVGAVRAVTSSLFSCSFAFSLSMMTGVGSVQRALSLSVFEISNNDDDSILSSQLMDFFDLPCSMHIDISIKN